MGFKKFYYILYFVLVCDGVYGQFSSNIRHAKVGTQNIVNVIDSLSIVPHSLLVPSVSLESYKVDEINATLIWIKPPKEDSVDLIYRVFPFRFAKKNYRFNYNLIRNNFLAEAAAPYVLNKPTESSIFNFNSVEANGIIGRSFSLGNNQDAVLNSTLNLQLHGFLADSMELTASISDNNIPIQPDGNTKDLRDFDRILIQVKKKDWQLNMGDLDLKADKNYFLNFKKRIQGVSFLINTNRHSIQNSFAFSGAIAKGKFTNNKIIPIEGNQGPYRLQGLNNELYLVVLSGSERVYLDGELLVRGSDEDYTINYNTAEIIFTPKNLITKDRRIQVDFEYANRNYLNTQLFISNELRINDKIEIKLAAFTNKDNKNSTIDQPLDNKQLNLLKSIGDSLQNAFIINASPDSFAIGKLLYRKIDTFYNGNLHDSIFIFNNTNAPDLYNVSFSYVGQGKGNYKQLLAGTNGRVYQWIAPVNNIKQGDFEAGNFIPSPKLQQIISASLKVKLGKHSSIQSESAMSYNDLNLLSNLDINNKSGWASKIAILDTIQGIQIFRGENQLIGSLTTEYIQASYKPLERLRNIEFLRDWNLTIDNAVSSEFFSTFTILLKGKKNNIFRTENKYLRKENNYEGNKQLVNWDLNCRDWRFSALIDNLTFRNTVNSGMYFRPYMLVNKKWSRFHNIISGVVASGEYNKVVNTFIDTLNFQSFAFRKIEAFVKSPAENYNKWEIRYFNFLNWYPDKYNLFKSDESHNYFIQTQLLKNESNQCLLNIGYRNYKVIKQFLPNQNQDQTLLSRMEFRFNKCNNLISGNLFYETGSGQEQKKEFSYIQVPVGQGSYFWIDYNNNGIEELNEFEIAVFQDQKKYIKIYTPSNDFVKSNYMNFNYDVTIKFEQLTKNNQKLLRYFLKKFEYNSSLQLEKKIQAINSFVINPFEKYISDSRLIIDNTSFIQNVFFNRLYSKWGIDLFQIKNSTKSLVTYGFEDRFYQTQSIKFRYNFEKKYQLNVFLKNIKNELKTSGVQFENRNYKISQIGIQTHLIYTLQAKLRFTFGMEWNEKKNLIDSLDICKTNNLNIECKYNVLYSASITARLTKKNNRLITYQGGERTPVGFIMLDGLTVGNNYLINVDLTKKIGSRFEWSLQYEGRSNQSNKFIHIGRSSIRAIF